MQSKTYMYNIVHLEDKNQENLPLKELRARNFFLYQQIENSGGTNRIRGFPVEHSWVSTNCLYKNLGL